MDISRIATCKSLCSASRCVLNAPTRTLQPPSPGLISRVMIRGAGGSKDVTVINRAPVSSAEATAVGALGSVEVDTVASRARLAATGASGSGSPSAIKRGAGRVPGNKGVSLPTSSASANASATPSDNASICSGSERSGRGTGRTERDTAKGPRGSSYAGKPGVRTGARLGARANPISRSSITRAFRVAPERPPKTVAMIRTSPRRAEATRFQPAALV